MHANLYCKFRNFCMTFILRIFVFQIISEVLNLRASTFNYIVYDKKAYSNSLLVKTLFSRNFIFVKRRIREYWQN